MQLNILIYSYFQQKPIDVHKAFVQEQKSFRDAITVATLSKDHNNKTHPHQWRVDKAALLDYSKILLDNFDIIQKQTDFDSMYKLLKSLKIKGIGELTIYDIADRICYYKNIEPKKIYLHAGTRKGLEKLLNKKITFPTIQKEDLSKEFVDFSIRDIENFLCYISKSNIK